MAFNKTYDVRNKTVRPKGQCQLPEGLNITSLHLTAQLNEAKLHDNSKIPSFYLQVTPTKANSRKDLESMVVLVDVCGVILSVDSLLQLC